MKQLQTIPLSENKTILTNCIVNANNYHYYVNQASKIITENRLLTLDKIQVNQPVRLVSLGESQGFRHKLLAMGFIPGSSLTITGIGPLGSPVQVLLRGYTLSLRRVECQQIEVEYLHE